MISKTFLYSYVSNVLIMKNPIGKIRREKLEEISLEIESFKEQFNLISERIVLLDSIQNDISTFILEMKPIIELFQQPDEEPSEEDMKKEQEEQMKMFETVVQNAVINLMNKPETQQGLMELAGRMKGGPQGFQDMGFDLGSIQNKDGEVDPMSALIMWFMNRDKMPKGGGTRSPLASSSGKTGAY